jgi:4-hydroxybutyryl-CoA dehydratase/vinylacetyl-CoA-Delta-isomerase
MMMNGKQYVESIKKMRPNIYKWGKLIEDVTTHPATALHIKSVSRSYDLSFDPEKAPIYTTKSSLSGETIHRWNSFMDSAEAVLGNANMKRDQYHQSGTCQGATCAGWTAMNSLWDATFECDKELGTTYHERLKKFMKFCEDNALALAGAITDAKGDRSKKASQQANKDVTLHVKEVQPDGIIVRGYKLQICGVAACHYIVAMPGTGYGGEDKDFAIAFAVPRDEKGITIVETRRPSDNRDEEEGWDAPKAGNITQTFILFDDVFIPNERVFMCGEFKYSGRNIGQFSAIYRAAIGACVAGQGDIMIGAAINMARANGLSQRTFQATLTQMAVNNEITYGLGLGAMFIGKKQKSGLFVPNALLAHANKTQVATLPYQTKVMAQDISGGIAETGCMPSFKDFQNPDYGPKLLQALTAGADGASRAKMARLVEWLTVGGGIPGCMHGGGSPDGAKLVVRAMTKWEEFAEMAKRIMEVPSEAIKEPASPPKK